MKIILTTLFLAAILFAGAYFVSDPFKTRVDTLFQSATTWTDENIARDPGGYLRWALGEFDATEDALRGRLVSLRTQLNSLERRQEADRAQKPRVREALETLKNTYREAHDREAWPVSVNGIEADESELRQLIIEADRRLEVFAENERRYDLAIPRTRADIQSVETVLAELRERRGEVNRQLQQVRLDTTLHDLDTLDDRINALLDTTTSLRNETEGTLRLDDLLLSDPSEVDSRRFQEIMNRE